MTTKLFDLNIEEILDNWEIFHAVREIIANALDEQFVSSTADIKIYPDERGHWHIRDYGRGIKIEHFTLNEDQEKLSYPSGVIGKFGVGLKDALATFDRHGVGVSIQSHFGRFTLREATKHGFDSINTLHVQFDDLRVAMDGTDVILSGVDARDITKAKSLFMAFANEEVIETSTYGEIIRKNDGSGRVYINGVLASKEPNFLFSYNITNLTDSMRKQLNRERLNVGRSTYTERVKSILKSAKSETVQDMLADQVSKRALGTQCDEMQWLDISQLAFNYLDQREQVAYVTEKELDRRPEVIDNIKRDGLTPVVVSDTQKEKIDRQIKKGGSKLRTVEIYSREYNESFQYKFVDIKDLTSSEKKVFSLAPHLFDLVGIQQSSAPEVKISETMRITQRDPSGVWDRSLQAIVILRKQLSNSESYAGTLLHEITHASTNLSDVTREFETALTDYLGKVAITALRNAGVEIN